MSTFRTLWRVDVRRGLRQARGALVLIPLVLLLLLARDEEPASVAHVLIGLSCAFAVGFPVLMMRDRLDGSLDMLAGLPVPGIHIARARLAAVATICLLGGVQIGGAALLLFRPGLTPLHRAALAIAAGGVGWVVLTAGGFLVGAFMTRYPLHHAANRILINTVLVLIFMPLLIDMIWPEVPVWSYFFALPTPLLVATVLLLAAGAIAVSLRMMAKGIDRFEPVRESLLM